MCTRMLGSTTMIMVSSRHLGIYDLCEPHHPIIPYTHHLVPDHAYIPNDLPTTLPAHPVHFDRPDAARKRQQMQKAIRRSGADSQSLHDRCQARMLISVKGTTREYPHVLTYRVPPILSIGALRV